VIWITTEEREADAQAGTQAEAWEGDYDVRVIKYPVVTLKQVK
jgi:hypothetical protein